MSLKFFNILKIEGIKKVPIITKYLPYVDIIKNFGFDYMHGICLNIFKHFATYWFTEKWSSYNFSLFQKKDEIEQNYLQLKFPYFKTRKPRRLEDFDDWKAIEYR